MRDKIKKYIGPIFGLIGSLLSLTVGISYITFGLPLGGFYGLVPVFSFFIFVLGLIGAIVGFFGGRSISKGIMIIAGVFALLFILSSGIFLSIFSMLLLILAVFSTILIIIGGILVSSPKKSKVKT